MRGRDGILKVYKLKEMVGNEYPTEALSATV